jgi:hypothetical protein
MHNKTAQILSVVAASALAFSAITAFADKDSQPAVGGAPAMDMKAMMAAMEAMGAINENHKLLESLVGTWDYRIKMWMDPSAPPQESSGIAVTKPLMGGRYFQSDHTGTMEMPGPDGKPVVREFVGMAITGYNNLKKKFFSSWIDNMSTAMMIVDGTYDSATKTFAYGGEMDCPLMPPGSKLKIREVIRIVGPDQHVFEWYETRNGPERRTMEITYTRKK